MFLLRVVLVVLGVLGVAACTPSSSTAAGPGSPAGTGIRGGTTDSEITPALDPPLLPALPIGDEPSVGRAPAPRVEIPPGVPSPPPVIGTPPVQAPVGEPVKTFTVPPVALPDPRRGSCSDGNGGPTACAPQDALEPESPPSEPDPPSGEPETSASNRVPQPIEPEEQGITPAPTTTAEGPAEQVIGEP